MSPSLRRGVTSALVSFLPWGLILVVEFAGKEPSVSGMAKSLVVSAVVLVLLSAVVIPVGGGVLTLVAARRDLGDPVRRAQAMAAAVLGLTLILCGLRWLAWVVDPRQDPPGM